MLNLIKSRDVVLDPDVVGWVCEDHVDGLSLQNAFKIWLRSSIPSTRSVIAEAPHIFISGDHMLLGAWDDIVVWIVPG